MTKDPSRASEVLKERKYGAPPSGLAATLGPEEVGKIKRRLAAYIPAVVLYFFLREVMKLDIVMALVAAVPLGIMTYLLLRPARSKK